VHRAGRVVRVAEEDHSRALGGLGHRVGIESERFTDGNHLDRGADAAGRLVRGSIRRRRGDERLLGRAERARGRFENRTGPGADDDVVAADAIDVGNRAHEIACIVRRISSSDPRRDRVSKRVHRLLAGTARVLIRADSDEAAIIGRLQGPRLEGHGLVTAADDERRGQQASAAQSQIPEEIATGQ
jgi:hypothetical protein